MDSFVSTHLTYDRQAADKNEIMHKEVSLYSTFSLFFPPRRLWSEQIDDGVTE